MRICFPVDAFAEAARTLRAIVPASLDIDILQHARIEADPLALRMTMSQGDLQLSAAIEGGADAACLAAIPRAVLDFLALRQGEKGEASLEFDADMREVVARHGRARLTMPVLRGSDFPVMACGGASWTVRLRAHEFCAALQRCEKAVSTNESQFMMAGPFLHRRHDALAMVATDAYHLHHVALDGVPLEGDFPVRDGMAGIIIPPYAMKEIRRVWSGDESEIAVFGDDGMMVVEGSRVTLVSKLIDAAYCAFERIMPPRPGPRVVVPAERLARAIDGVLTVPKTDVKGRKETARTVTLTVQADAIGVAARGTLGDAEDTVEATPLDGFPEGTAITFGAQFMRDAVEAIGTREVAIHPPAQIGLPFHVSGVGGGEQVTVIVGQRRA